MKIVQLVYHLSSGGAEKFVTDLSNSLARRGEDVTVLMLRDAALPEYYFNGRFLLPGVKVVSLQLPEGFRISYIPKVRKALDALAPDVVHSHLGVLPYIFFYAFARKKIHFVHTVHALASFDTPSAVLKHLNRMLFRRRVRAVTISKACNDSFKKYYGLDNSVVIENGRDRLQPSAKYTDVANELKDMQRPVFIHVARFSPVKNQQLLLAAFARMRAEGRPGTLLVVGGGFEDGGDIVSMAGPDVHFLGLKDNVGDYLLNSDYFCLSSVFEGMPISVIEAISCGLPVISTPAGGVCDMIENGVNGILASDFSEDSFLKALEDGVGTAFTKERIVKCYEDRFSMDLCAGKYIDEYGR